jgi:hypothetical protein
MPRALGSPTIIGVAKLFIAEDWICEHNKHRYVFADVILPKVHEISTRYSQSKRLYGRFYQSLVRGLYNQTTLYGLRAIDIDQPQKPDLPVSVRLEFVIGEGEDSYEHVWIEAPPEEANAQPAAPR